MLADAAWLAESGGAAATGDAGGTPSNVPGVLLLDGDRLRFVTEGGSSVDEQIVDGCSVEYTLNVFVTLAFPDPARAYKFGFAAARASDVPPALLEEHGIDPSAGAASKPGLDSAKKTFRARKIGKRWRSALPPRKAPSR